jgi:hypothetical protein
VDAAPGATTIARRETLCARLSSRLGVKDVCNQKGESGLPRIAAQARNLALGVPGSAYTRSDESPLIPRDPNLFFTAGGEKLCMALAGQLVESGATARWRIAQKDAALAEFVSVVMGVPPADPRSPALLDVLNRHHAAALAAKESAAESLRSTFTLACSSPLGVSTGL